MMCIDKNLEQGLKNDRLEMNKSFPTSFYMLSKSLNNCISSLGVKIEIGEIQSRDGPVSFEKRCKKYNSFVTNRVLVDTVSQKKSNVKFLQTIILK